MASMSCFSSNSRIVWWPLVDSAWELRKTELPGLPALSCKSTARSGLKRTGTVVWRTPAILSAFCLGQGGLSLQDSQHVPFKRMILFGKTLKDAPQLPAPLLFSIQSQSVVFTPLSLPCKWSLNRFENLLFPWSHLMFLLHISKHIFWGV